MLQIMRYTNVALSKKKRLSVKSETLDLPNHLSDIRGAHPKTATLQLWSLENALVTNIAALHYVYQTRLHIHVSYRGYEYFYIIGYEKRPQES